MIDDHLPQLRLRSQRLSEPQNDAVDLVHHLCALQAQEHHSAILAVRPRITGTTAADVEHTLYHYRTLIRTWLMRGTLHIVSADDLAWLLPLIAPDALRKSQRRLRELDLTPDVLDRALPAIADILRGSPPLTRHQIAAELDPSIPTAGQAIVYLLYVAAFHGLICWGPEQGRDSTYVLLEDWHPLDFIPPDDGAHTRLARRYLSGCAPASVDDFAYWAGISLKTARTAFDALSTDLHEVTSGDEALMMLSDHAHTPFDAPDTPSVVLIPGYDPYLLGYRTRDFMVDAEYARHIHPGGGVIRPTVLVDGRAAGIWSLRKKGKGRQLTVTPFEAFLPDVHDAIDAEVEDIARFLDQDVQRVDGVLSD